MTRSNLVLSLVLAVLTPGLLPGPASAQTAKLRPVDDPVMGCALQFTGQIAEGDAALFEQAVAQQSMDSLLGYIGDPGTRICFDSPGGSLSEGIKIAKIIHNRYGTAVAAGAVCESACAVAFMGGSREPEGDPRGGVVDRVLHPLGKLGFHAPSLSVPDQSYGKATVDRAFDLAMNSVGLLVANMGTFDFPESLLTRLLTTPSHDMFHITTVGEASRWRIAVAPTVHPPQIHSLAVFNACSNHYMYLSDFRGVSSFKTGDTHYVSLPNFPANIDLRNDLVEASIEGFGQEMAATCEISEWWGEGPASPWGWVGIGDGAVATSAYELYSFQLFTQTTLIANLAPAHDAAAGYPDEFREEPWSNRMTGHCFLYRGTAPLADEPCQLESEAVASEDLSERHEFHLFKTESGARVMLSRANGAWTVGTSWDDNGRATELEYSADFDPAAQNRIAEFGQAMGGQGWFVNCLAIPADGTRLCFLGHAPDGGLVHFGPWETSIPIFR